MKIEFSRILKTPPTTQKAEGIRSSQISNARSEGSEKSRVR